MRVRAKCSFAGEVSMALNEVRDVPEGDVLDDLVSCGYVVPEEAEKNENKENIGSKSVGRKAGVKG